MEQDSGELTGDNLFLPSLRITVLIPSRCLTDEPFVTSFPSVLRVFSPRRALYLNCDATFRDHQWLSKRNENVIDWRGQRKCWENVPRESQEISLSFAPSVCSWFCENEKRRERRMASSDGHRWYFLNLILVHPHRRFNLFLWGFIHIDYSDPAFFHSSSSLLFPLSPVPYLNLITMSVKGRRFLARPDCDKVRSKVRSVRRWWHRGKIPAWTKKRKRTRNPSWISAFPPCCLPDPFRPCGTARGGNCIKVDVGYARAAPSARGIINSQRRAVTKVRACSLVSRSVSGQADSSSPSSFRHLHHFTPFSSARVPLTWKSSESIRAQ